MPMKLSNILSLLRVHQYVKNLFVFAPVLFSLQYSVASITSSVIAFIAFSLLASGVYIFNDLMDIEQDREHPRKKFRPLACGAIEKNTAVYLLVFLIVISIFISLLLPANVLLLLLAYLVLNFAYSLKLKHITIIDIFVISIGFVLRVVIGAQSSEVYLSMWLLIMTFLLALFLALSKRRDDVLLANDGRETRKNIDGYNLEFVNAGMLVLSAVIIVSYIQYTISTEVVERLGTHNLYLTTLFVILGIMRYMQITFVFEKSESPTRIVLKDKFLQVTIVCWLGSFFALSLLG